MSDEIKQQDIFNAVTATRLEINESLQRTEKAWTEALEKLSLKFDNLENVRLLEVETKVVLLTARVTPVERIVYGCSSLILVSVVGAGITWIISRFNFN